jgi:NRPS condensation-like uncharacterized protein
MSDPTPDVAADGEPATLQTRLEDTGESVPDGAGPAPAVEEPAISDPVALLRHLDVSGRFHRDSWLGRVYHRGEVSLRENVEADSLHIAIRGNRLKAHVDRESPLTTGRDGSSRYSLRRAVAHNGAGMAQDLLWLLRGRQGDHSCKLDSEWVPEAASPPADVEPLDPRASAWSVHVEASVAGRLDEARLRAALRTALGASELECDPVEVVVCDDDEALARARSRLHGLHVPATRLPPLHVYLARRRDGDVLMLNLNHAATDGFGAVAVLRSIARAYAGEAAGAEPLDFLALRDLPVRPTPASRSIVEHSTSRVVERLRDMRDRPARIVPVDPVDEPGHGTHLVALSAEETPALVDLRHARKSTNMLMAALHLAIGDWNEQHGVARGRIGVLVAADLRPARWRANTVANLSVNARVSTRVLHRRHAASALRFTTAQIVRNKRSRTGVALIAGLERAGLLALWAKQSSVVLQPLTGNHMVDTAVLCNVGSLEQAPWFGPDAGATTEVWLSVPARAPLSLSLGALLVGGRLHLTFRYPRRLFSPEAARRFADCYLRHLRAVGEVRR